MTASLSGGSGRRWPWLQPECCLGSPVSPATCVTSHPPEGPPAEAPAQPHLWHPRLPPCPSPPCGLSPGAELRSEAPSCGVPKPVICSLPVPYEPSTASAAGSGRCCHTSPSCPTRATVPGPPEVLVRRPGFFLFLFCFLRWGLSSWLQSRLASAFRVPAWKCPSPGHHLFALSCPVYPGSFHSYLSPQGCHHCLGA